MATLYVVEPGARLEKEYHRLAVFKDDELLLRVPLSQVSDVVLVGQVGVTLQALISLLDEGVPLSLITSTGQLRGRLSPPEGRNIPLRHQQYRCASDPGFCLAISRAIVRCKLHNERVLARRICRNKAEIDAAPIEIISHAMQLLDGAADLHSLRGLEGAAARAYFKCFRQALRSGWESPRRSRRPPRDPLNALLSLGYTLLGQNMMTALELAGLDPYDGFFHSDCYGRPALALDLVEEFRSLIADSVVLEVINKRIIKPEDFYQSGCGVYLKTPALRKFLENYRQRLQQEVFHPSAGKKLTYQKCMEVQARLVRKVIEGQNMAYEGFRTS